MTLETVYKKCSRCGSRKIILDVELGEEFCSRCGLVISKKPIDPGPEKRIYDMEDLEKKARTGLPGTYTIYDKGLSTSFGGHRDARGNKLDLDTVKKMNKLKRYDVRSKLSDTKSRNLSIAMTELDRLSTKLSIPKIVKEKAALIYREALNRDLVRGRSIDDFVAASLYAACRLLKIPRSLKQVSQASTRKLSDISRTYRLLLKQLELRMPIDYPMKFVPKISSKINVSRDTELLTEQILLRAKENKVLTGKNPKGVAAAALYLACKIQDEECKQKEVAEAAGITEVTLRNRLKDLENLFEKEQLTLHTQLEPGIEVVNFPSHE